jgi:hypothetical protein
MATANAALLKSRAEYIDEVNQPYPWMKSTGLRPGQIFGYIAEGFFKNQQEINASATIDGYAPVPGDIKYRDLNKDNVINQFDRTALGTLKPEINYGLTLSAKYKQLEINILVNGIANRDILLNGVGRYEFQTYGNGFGQAFKHHLNRWTPATAATATYPRLTLGNNPNNHQPSTFWIKAGDYFRLRNAELAYTIKNKFFTKNKVSGIRVFVNGFNLLTLTALDDTDPEVTSGYPNSRNFSAGATICFF